MTSTRFQMLLLASAMLAATAAPVGATPVVSFADFYTDRFAPSPLASFPVGDFVAIVASIDGASTPDPISSLSVEATQGSSTVALNYSSSVALISPGLYSTRIPFAGAVTSVGWSITATDSTGTSAPVFTPPIVSPALLPFVTDIAVSDMSTTPTVSWTLPDLTGFSVDLARIRIIDANTGLQLFGAQLPTIASTSFMVPFGILAPGGSYVYRVSLADQAGGTLDNQSNAFSGVATVPEPGTLTLLLAGLTGIGGVRAWVRARAGETARG